MSADLDERLAGLADLGGAELRVEWERVWKRAAPPLTPDLLRRGIAWRLQANIHGGWSPAVLRELNRLVRQLEKGGPLLPDRVAKPGTRLIREWRGKTYQVTAIEEGFLYQGRLYASLTRIAKEITGTQWSGPVFFGLKRSGGAGETSQ